MGQRLETWCLSILLFDKYVLTYMIYSTGIHGLRLALLGLDISQSSDTRNELQASNNTSLSPIELGTLDHGCFDDTPNIARGEAQATNIDTACPVELGVSSYERSDNPASGISEAFAGHRDHIFWAPTQASSPIELAVISMSHQSSDTGSSFPEPVVPVLEQVESETSRSNSRFRCPAWEFEWETFDSPSQDYPHRSILSHSSRQASSREPALPIPAPLPDIFTGDQSSARRYESYDQLETIRTSRSRYSGNLPREYDMLNLANRNPGQSSVVTFHCSRFGTCERYCSCICHSSQNYKSPSLFNKLIGSLFVGYTGNPVSKLACDKNTCVNQVSYSLRVSYTFPAWFVGKQVDLIGHISTAGPCFGLTTYNMIDASAGVNIISLAQAGDTLGIKKILNAHKASMRDRTILGDSPFSVSLQAYYTSYDPDVY